MSRSGSSRSSTRFRLELAPNSARDAVVLSIRHHGVTDHIAHRLTINVDAAPLVAGPLQTDGEVAFVREQDGYSQPHAGLGRQGAALGGRAAGGRWHIRGKRDRRAPAGRGAPYNALLVTGSLPEAESLHGATVIVTFGDGSTYGYPIARVESGQGESRIVLEADPGVAVTPKEARHLFFPGRTMPGPVT